MIRLTTALPLLQSDVQELQRLQQLIDNTVGYPNQVAIADQKWSNKPDALLFRVREALDKICCGARRCGYCEDSMADEVEHIRPKNWFPNQTFDPTNYLFACGPCNGPKSNDYAVVDSSGALNEVKRTKNAAILPPPAGQEALLHPWLDNPSQYLFLDLVNTFEFKARSSLNNQQKARANYTILTLRINKDPLQRARREAFHDFAGRLNAYHHAEKRNEARTYLDRMRDELLQKQHITVWREMQQQSSLLPFLKDLFNLVPGADIW